MSENRFWIAPTSLGSHSYPIGVFRLQYSSRLLAGVREPSLLRYARREMGKRSDDGWRLQFPLKQNIDPLFIICALFTCIFFVYIVYCNDY